MTMNDVLNRMRQGGLIIFVAESDNELLNVFAAGKDYSDFIAGKIITEDETTWLINGVRVPNDGLRRLRTQSLLIKSQKTLSINKSDFKVVE